MSCILGCWTANGAWIIAKGLPVAMIVLWGGRCLDTFLDGSLTIGSPPYACTRISDGVHEQPVWISKDRLGLVIFNGRCHLGVYSPWFTKFTVLVELTFHRQQAKLATIAFAAEAIYHMNTQCSTQVSPSLSSLEYAVLQIVWFEIRKVVDVESKLPNSIKTWLCVKSFNT